MEVGIHTAFPMLQALALLRYDRQKLISCSHGRMSAGNLKCLFQTKIDFATVHGPGPDG